MFEEFKKFVMRGNVVDLAIGIVIGAAFKDVINSFVDNILMPPIGLLIGDVDFSNLFITLSGGSYQSLKEAQDAGAATLNYGLFINSIINYIIIAFVIFLLIRWINKVTQEAEKKEETEAPPTTKACPYCMLEIPIKAVRCPECTSQLEPVSV